MKSRIPSPALRLTALFLMIEFVDELVDSLCGTSLPAIRTELALTYIEVGALYSAPHVFGSVAELAFGLLADQGHRTKMMLAGGVFFTVSLFGIAGSTGYPMLLLAFMMFNPAGGAFVSLAQTCLMDLAPARKAQMMARWTFAGTVAHLAGPAIYLGCAHFAYGWRSAFLFAGAIAAGTVAVLGRAMPLLPVEVPVSRSFDLPRAFRSLVADTAKPSVLKWVVALELADLMLDVLTAFVALYLVDSLRLSVGHAALLLFARAAAAVAGEGLAIVLLERVRGPHYLAVSATLAIVFYGAFLTCTTVVALTLTLVLVTMATSGWYSVLKASLYDALPNRGGTVMAVTSLTGLARGLVPLGFGAIADRCGISAAMWLLGIGAIAVIVVACTELRVFVGSARRT